jgi:hypothetical protein
VAGKTHCQSQSRPALGYFRESAVGLDPAGARLDVASVLLANGVEMADQIPLDE